MKKPAKPKVAPAVKPISPSRPAETRICVNCLFRAARTLGGFSCHRYPPTPLAGAGQVRPLVRDEDWCGEFTAKV